MVAAKPCLVSLEAAQGFFRREGCHHWLPESPAYFVMAFLAGCIALAGKQSRDYRLGAKMDRSGRHTERSGRWNPCVFRPGNWHQGLSWPRSDKLHVSHSPSGARGGKFGLHFVVSIANRHSNIATYEAFVLGLPVSNGVGFTNRVQCIDYLEV
jgi:hypothetical protein